MGASVAWINEDDDHNPLEEYAKHAIQAGAVEKLGSAPQGSKVSKEDQRSALRDGPR